MTNLSPAAQAVLSAYINAPCGKPRSVWVAAALRAAADHIQFQDQLGLTAYGGHSQAQRQLLSIAAELEGAND
jgi:hypothetical protein